MMYGFFDKDLVDGNYIAQELSREHTLNAIYIRNILSNIHQIAIMGAAK